MLPSSDPHSVDQSSCANCNSYLRDLERGFQSHKFLVGKLFLFWGEEKWQGKELVFFFFLLDVLFVFQRVVVAEVYLSVAKIEFFLKLPFAEE